MPLFIPTIPDGVLLLIEPNAGVKAKVSHAFRTQIAESNTGVEERMATREAWRMEVTYSYLLTKAEGEAMRARFLQPRDTRVFLPLWMDRLPAGIYASTARLYAARRWLNWDPDSLAFTLDADAGHPESMGLVVGYLKERPRLQAVDGETARVTITLSEDGPFAWRVEPQWRTMASWELVPAWKKAVDDLTRDQFEAEEIGYGREAAISGQESAVRRGQEAGFKLHSRDDIQKLLSFFWAHRGAWHAFELPRWYQPDADIEAAADASYQARFDSDVLTLEFESGEVAATTLRFWQEIALAPGAPPQAIPGRAFLYELRWKTSGATKRFTSYERELAVLGEQWLPRRIDHDAVSNRMDDPESSLELLTDNFADNPLRAFARLEIEDTLEVIVREVEVDTPTTVAVLFTGSVIDADIDGRQIKGKVASLGGLLNRTIPRFLDSTTCNYCIYGTLCRINKADHRFAGSVGAAAGIVVDVSVGSGDAADVFANSYVRVGAGDTMERRAIVRSAPLGGGVQRLTLSRPLRNLGVGAAVELFRGCDGQASTCESRFGNYINFGGFPWMPAYIEAVETGFKAKTGK